LINSNINVVGCDTFCGIESTPKDYLLNPSDYGSFIFKMPNGKIPFNDNSFDLIINNQVLEHVSDIDYALSEMNRVLKSGGYLLSLFPDKHIWREGHVGIAFSHCFSKGSKVRWLYLFIFRLIGFCYHKKNKNIIEWTNDRSKYLDEQTFYISYTQIENIFNKYFHKITHYEDIYASMRFGNCVIVKFLPNCFLKFFIRKLGGLIFDAQKI
jgi:ubiquinone/menaquinone biosynthesis C-methylase UbiE